MESRDNPLLSRPLKKFGPIRQKLDLAEIWMNSVESDMSEIRPNLSWPWSNCGWIWQSQPWL